MYNGFNNSQAYWWETIYIFRKVAMTAITVFFPNDYNSQGLFAIVVIVAAMNAQNLANPFESKICNRVECFSLVCTFCIFMCGQLTYADSTHQMSGPASIVALVIMCLYLTVMVIVLVYASCKKKTHELLSKIDSPYAGTIELHPTAMTALPEEAQL